MIKLSTGNLIESQAEALVNTVNCVGFMGKGIALQFKKAFPDNFKAYERACRAKEVRPGRMLVFPTGSMMNPKYIINFPTKRHWRGKSLMEDIESGLKALIADVRKLGIQSIAIPPLGCGLGGLEWSKVKPLIEAAFKSLPHVSVELYEPVGTPDAKTMPIGTLRPNLTIPRALLIRLMHQYAGMAYRLTLLEIQKLAYFLQEAGEPLKLKYEAHIYGPYAHNLNKVLERLEGHFIRGYGDNQKPEVDIDLLPGAAEEAEKFLTDYDESISRLQRVAEVIAGFETPYGMELLASIHWLGVHGKPPVKTSEDAISGLAQWNDRKKRMFKPDHANVAWERLAEQGWLLGARAASTVAGRH